MTNADLPTDAPAANQDDTNELSAKSIARCHDTFGGIRATVYETRFASGGCRYSVVFERDVSDLSLQGTFHSLGQDELMDLVAAASNAHFRIEHLRMLRRCGDLPDASFEQLTEAQGWEPAVPEEYYDSQIEWATQQ